MNRLISSDVSLFTLPLFVVLGLFLLGHRIPFANPQASFAEVQTAAEPTLERGYIVLPESFITDFGDRGEYLKFDMVVAFDLPSDEGVTLKAEILSRKDEIDVLVTTTVRDVLAQYAANADRSGARQTLALGLRDALNGLLRSASNAMPVSEILFRSFLMT